MGREAASYAIALPEHDARAVARRLHAGGVELARAGDDRIDFVVRDPHRYWIDLRIHAGDEPRLQILIALTNDTWSLRGPLERALMPLAAELDGRALRDDAGTEVAIVGTDGWLLAFEDDYGRRRDAFVARVGDFTAPISADHVYLYVHQTRWNRDNDDELAWHREREIARLEESWDDDLPEVEPGEPV